MNSSSPQHSSSQVLELHGESVHFKGSTALENISLKIDAGEKIAVIGPSGAGKTTLLRTLYQKTPNSCAFIHQHHSLVTQLSVFHNIYMGRLDAHSNLHNVRTLIKPQKADIDEISAIADTLGIVDKLWSKVGNLSGGQQQRVGIGRALYRGGEILMADEPVSSLDMVQGREIVKLITELGNTVISALHFVELSVEFFDRIIGLREQKLLFDIPSSDVTKTQLQRLYGETWLEHQ